MPRLQIALAVCAIVNFAIAAWDAATGGIQVNLFGIAFSSWEIRRPLGYAAMSTTLAVWLRDQSAAVTTWDLLYRHGRKIAIVIALASTALAIHFGVFAAGGADAYGYVSQASLWASGKLFLPNRLAEVTPQLGGSVVPVGYRMSPASDAIVPVYSPGLPLLMALAQKIGGEQAVYLVVPLLGGLAVWLTYMFAERLDGRRTAVVACALLALSPLFIFHTLEPMSDVPTTAWWMAALVLATGSGLPAAFGGGLAAAAAILTRPNLVPLALVMAGLVARERPRMQRVIAFAAPLTIACLAIAVLNRTFHGTMLVSGYGPLEYLYSSDRIVPNLQRYVAWLVDTHSALIFLALAAPFVIPGAVVIWVLVFIAVLVAGYLPYFTYDHWTFLRFLLPAVPLFLILASIVVIRSLERLSPRFRGGCVVGLSAAAALWFGIKLETLQVLALQDAEHRYVTVGQTIGSVLPPNAVVITVVHSGSVRLYGDRPTVRWDGLKAECLDDAVAILVEHGYEPYILLEEWEEPLFKARFGAANAFGRVEWPPAIEYYGEPRVRIYAAAARAKYLTGASPPPLAIPSPD
jgi:hypothetical protein